jgi:hypothetical protein
MEWVAFTLFVLPYGNGDSWIEKRLIYYFLFVHQHSPGKLEATSFFSSSPVIVTMKPNSSPPPPNSELLWSVSFQQLLQLFWNCWVLCSNILWRILIICCHTQKNICIIKIRYYMNWTVLSVNVSCTWHSDNSLYSVWCETACLFQ